MPAIPLSPMMLLELEHWPSTEPDALDEEVPDELEVPVAEAPDG